MVLGCVFLVNESEFRKKLNFRDVDKLSQEINHNYYKDVLNGEIFFSRYGMDRNLKKYVNMPLNHKIHALFEHGVQITDYVGGAFRIHEYLPSIVASKYRVNVLKNQENFKGAYAIGPYIHYADSLLSKDQLKEEKESLGSTLLVFPSHSIEEATSKFDYHMFIKNINDIAKDYETVRICMYYRDIVLKKHIPYLNEGFQVVTAGHYNDYYFLPRLRNIIENSDMTMSNEFGTQLGYCIYLKKPHFINKIDVTFEVSENNIIKKNTSESTKKLEYSDNLSKIYELFCEYGTNISKDQQDFVSYLWGFDEIKTPQELEKIILKINNDYYSLKYYWSCFQRFKEFMSIKFNGK